MTDEQKNRELDRREFLGISVGAAMLFGMNGYPGLAQDKTGVQYRTLGHTGERVSCIGLGGYHIGIQGSEDESIRIIRRAIDGGINFLDNCWDYNDGGSEVRMGKALRDGYRKRAFLMTKIDGHDGKTATKQLEDSLRRLQTDHLDLLQFHEVIRPTDPDRIFAANGSFEAMQKAKQAGKIRYLGYTGHKDPEIHLKMLSTALAHNWTPDSVQMPLNVMDTHFNSFEHKVLPELVKHNIGVLGMKPMGSGVILQSKVVTPVECLTYALSLPTSVVITGCDSMQVVDQALKVAREFKPPSEKEVAALRAKTAPVAMAGKYELYKTSSNFDGTAHNPQWLGGAP
ncbi:aldo/keto reductase [Candidatus Koribacter versatilis Ellin345]|uniref:Aldo/keto reductase n=1 Tax=Koribacter versatilis (strain Ellin345) TaxID=204669 RepID=Q1IHZ2_KORVE|nr:aldo/keto reductase [Candidatus Koribacter versatilis]ABF43508.1 aldo/keto reductase [Candidatus Koribacter versatilis Ellin345]